MLYSKTIFPFLLAATVQLCGGISTIALLNKVEIHSCPSIITDHERAELQIDRLVTQLDYTKTSFGTWGLTHLLNPIADKDEIIARQNIIKFLMDNQDVLHSLQQNLHEIQKTEEALLSYWDEHDQVAQNSNQFYYTLPGLKQFLNHNSFALNAGVTVQMCSVARNLLLSMCMGGIADEWTTWMLTDKKELDIKGGMMRGLLEPKRYHSLELNILKDKKNGSYNIKDYALVLLKGSVGDKYHFMSNVTSQGISLSADQVGMQNTKVSYPVTAVASVFQKAFCVGWALFPTVAYDYLWAVNIGIMSKNIMHMCNSLKQLTNKVAHSATCCENIARAFSKIQKNSQLSSFFILGKHQSNEDMSEFITLVKTMRSCNQAYAYSPGHTLRVNKYIRHKKSLLIPFMQTIGLVDAYCSLAQMMKDHEQKDNKFCFVTFNDTSMPHIHHTNSWLPLLSSDNAVANDIVFGGNQASKVVITGPNGGGKSSILKQKGMAVILSQSVGIAAASCADQSLFYQLVTVLDPREDLKRGLSTFMAEKKAMQEVSAHIQKAQTNKPVLALIDEPYKGTVNDESARRIYNFGMEIAHNPNALVSIATHVKKPINLSADTGGQFANYSVAIKEESPGTFKRLFKLEKGPAHWWFEDKLQRGRFVDWIGAMIDAQS